MRLNLNIMHKTYTHLLMIWCLLNAYVHIFPTVRVSQRVTDERAPRCWLLLRPDRPDETPLKKYSQQSPPRTTTSNRIRRAITFDFRECIFKYIYMYYIFIYVCTIYSKYVHILIDLFCTSKCFLLYSLKHVCVPELQ